MESTISISSLAADLCAVTQNRQLLASASTSTGSLLQFTSRIC